MPQQAFCSDQCRTDGFTLVLEECPAHGGLFLRVYRHVRAVDVGELPLIVSGQFSDTEGEHEFYDTTIRVVSQVLAEMMRVD